MEYIIKIKKDSKNLLNDRWVWKMAWRDARRNFSRLFLFISSIIIGIAALVAINSFNVNLQNDINLQAKDLLGDPTLTLSIGVSLTTLAGFIPRGILVML